MNLASFLSSFLFPKNHPIQMAAPVLSLTAEDGSWKRSSDYIGNRNLLLIGCKSMDTPQSIQWLRSYAQQDFEEFDCSIFLLSTKSTEQLRAYKHENAISFPLLYDPLALEARKFGMSGRRPMCRDSLVLINKDGIVVFSACGQVNVTELVTTARDLLGFTPVENDSAMPPERVATNAVQMISSEQIIERMQGNQQYKMVDVRTLSEYEPDHVPGSQHIPVDELHQRYLEIGQLDSIVFICQAGGRAYSAAEFLASIGGTDLLVVEGGMSSWSGPRKTDGKIT